jgi:hypothetical protein
MKIVAGDLITYLDLKSQEISVDAPYFDGDDSSRAVIDGVVDLDDLAEYLNYIAEE